MADAYILGWGKPDSLCGAEKLGVYSNICKALKPGGRYVECDYMVEKQAEEDQMFAESKRIRTEQNIPDGEFYHLDIPCTIDNQVRLLIQAGKDSDCCIRNFWG